MTVIKDGAIAANGWTHVADGEALPAGAITVSLQRWQAEKAQLLPRRQTAGVRLMAADDPETLKDDLPHLGLIVLDMAAFSDGRVFSQARLLRERFGYTGELRARGDFLRDQMFFLARVGVNAFEFPGNTDLEDRLKAFQEFSVTYQAAADNREPLYRRR